MHTLTLSDKAWQQIAAIDKKLNDAHPHLNDEMQRFLDFLTKSGKVEVGWREACGKTDNTAKIYAEWCKVLKILERESVVLRVESVKHDNGYATSKGGFWNSNIYHLTSSK